MKVVKESLTWSETVVGSKQIKQQVRCEVVFDLHTGIVVIGNLQGLAWNDLECSRCREIMSCHHPSESQ